MGKLAVIKTKQNSSSVEDFINSIADGKYKTGSGCLYINKLEDVNIKILEKMIAASAK